MYKDGSTHHLTTIDQDWFLDDVLAAISSSSRTKDHKFVLPSFIERQLRCYECHDEHLPKTHYTEFNKVQDRPV